MNNNIIFRVDASLKIGHGHIKRCLALAYELKFLGFNVSFISRSGAGNLNNYILTKGFSVYPFQEQDDAAFTISTLRKIKNIVWLIIDNYEIDKYWEESVRDFVPGIMFIEDINNRPHNCDVLMDQTLFRLNSDYSGLISKKCKMLLGANYSLISKKYAKKRKKALLRRKQTEKLSNILVAFGGADISRALTIVIDALEIVPKKHTVNLVIRSLMSEADTLIERLKDTHHNVNVFTDIDDLSELVYMNDLAIGAGGVSSYERCCLGLPTILLQTAENQSANAKSLQAVGAVYCLGSIFDAVKEKIATAIIEITNNRILWKTMSKNAARVCDGEGASRVAQFLFEFGVSGEKFSKA